MRAHPFLCLAALGPVTLYAADLVIAEKGGCDYQIVVPDSSNDELVDHWLLISAKLMQAAFEKNGSKIDVVKEDAVAPNKHGVYLGATRFAKKNGIQTERHDDWTYFIKTVGKDLIIAGRDEKDSPAQGMKASLALLGTVKGVCDFLRQYAGVRFLFMSMDESIYAPRRGGPSPFNQDGSLKIDTRSIAFTPVEKIAVPEALDLKKTPLMWANYDDSRETFYNVAMNFFPRLSAVEGAEVVWYKAVPPAEYSKPHPEYFALTKDGQRACDLKVGSDDHMQYCVTSKGVQDLVCQAAERLVASGHKTISIATMDGFRLCQCNCEECNKLFGMKAESWEQIHARGKSGRLWQAYFNITERIRRRYPDVKIVLLNYQDTPVSADVITRFPDNVMVKIQFASQFDFDRIKGVEIPAGICGFEETFTGFGQAGAVPAGTDA